MNEWLLAALVITGEVALVLLVAVLAAVVWHFRGRSRRRGEVQQVLARLRQAGPERRQRLGTLLNEALGFGEEEAAARAEALAGLEQGLYRYVLRLFLYRREGIGPLEAHVQGLCGGYQGLLGGPRDAEAGDDDARPAGLPYTALRKERDRLQEELARQKDETAAVRAELASTKEALENMMREYATMFAGGSREGELQVREHMEKLKERIHSGSAPAGQAPEADAEAIPELEVPELTEPADAGDEGQRP